MASATRLRRSRDAWNEKAVHRGEALRQMRKDKERLRRVAVRIRQERVELEVALESLKATVAAKDRELSSIGKDLAALRAANDNRADVVPMDSHVHTRALCVKLVIAGVISFRSVPRVLDVFSRQEQRLPGWIPHFSSVINWALRTGVHVFRKVGRLREPWLALVDCSIDIGVKKALVVLRVPLAAVQREEGAVRLRDCECIGLKVTGQWNGDLVRAELSDVFGRAGNPIALIKDQGTDLAKGVRLYRQESRALHMGIVDDVGHATANALKATYAHQPSFRRYLEVVAKGAARIRQTDLAFLLPPRIRSKGRFMGISSLAKWTSKVQSLLNGATCLGEKHRTRLMEAFGGLLPLQGFIEGFVESASCLEGFLALLKNEGLNQASYVKAGMALARLTRVPELRARMEKWLETQVRVHRSLGIGQQRLLVSDDIIESLFGLFKVVMQRSPRAELNRLVYTIPLLCGDLGSEQVGTALQKCSHEDMRRYIARHIPETLRQQRLRVLNTEHPAGQEPGNVGGWR